jgi:hypothetical protein
MSHTKPAAFPNSSYVNITATISANIELIDTTKDMIEELLQQHAKSDRARIINALKKFQRRHEINGVGGASFRPGFVSLLDVDWREDLFNCTGQSQLESKLPAFLCLPTLHIDNLELVQGGNKHPASVHSLKSLLDYHYRYNKEVACESGNAFGADSFISPTTTTVHELLCLAVDKSENQVPCPHAALT